MIVLSGFGSGGQHLKLTTIMFQNIFPAIDVNTVKLSSCQRIVLLNYNKETKHIDLYHYSIRLQPVGVSRRIREFVLNHQVSDLKNLQDVSDFITKAGYGSESEADEEAATVTLTSDLGRVNRASTKSAVKLQEIGPIMVLQLIKVEEGLCSSSIIFSEYGMVSNKNEQYKNQEEAEENEYEENDEGNKTDTDQSSEVEEMRWTPLLVNKDEVSVRCYIWLYREIGAGLFSKEMIWVMPGL